MKLLFLLLVVINLILFGWEYQRQQQPPREHVRMELPAGVKRLQLVGEQGAMALDIASRANEKAADAMGGVEEPLAGSADGPGPSPATLADESPDDEPTPETAASPAQRKPIEEPLVAGTVESGPGVEPGTGTSAGSPVVDDPAAATESQAASAPSRQPGSVERPLTAANCFTFGPFKKLNEAETVAERLDFLVTDMQGREETQERQIGYWVLIPVQESRQAAREKVRELLDAGIRDVWRFTKGDLANAISLGLFSRRGPAERHRKAISEKGFETEVQPRYIDETSYWLDFRSSNEQGLPLELQQDLTRDYASAKLSPRECPPHALL